MGKAKASDVSRIGSELTKSSPPIPYVLGGQTIEGLDCQGYVEYCVNQCGGKMNYAGSNDMYRNAGAVYTMKEAKSLGYIVPGSGLLIVKNDGNEPGKYKGDGLGNASHVGFYLNTNGVEVGHASSSKGCVTGSTLKNGWTHVILFDAIDYSEYINESDDKKEEATMEGRYTVSADGGLRMRKTASTKGRYMLMIPCGTELDVTETKDGFGKVSYRGYDGWCSMDYLVPVQEQSDNSAYPSHSDDMVSIPRSVLISLADAGNTLNDWMSRQIFGVNDSVKAAASAIHEATAYLAGDD